MHPGPLENHAATANDNDMEMPSVDQMLARAKEIVITELCSEHLAAVNNDWKEFCAANTSLDNRDLMKCPSYVVAARHCLAEAIAIVEMDQDLARN